MFKYSDTYQRAACIFEGVSEARSQAITCWALSRHARLERSTAIQTTISFDALCRISLSTAKFGMLALGNSRGMHVCMHKNECRRLLACIRYTCIILQPARLQPY